MQQSAVELNSRENAIIEYLKGKYKVSTFELMSGCKTTRPSNEIVTLRKKGFNIITEYEKNPNTNKRYGVYTLLDKLGELKGNKKNGKSDGE